MAQDMSSTSQYVCNVVVQTWSTGLEGQNPTQGQACTVTPFHIVSPLLSMQGLN